MMRLFSNVKGFYNEINGATLTGAIDVIVVEQQDGGFKCSPFHVRFGKLGVLRSKEKVVDIEINGEPLDIHMKLGETGEAFFVEELDDEKEIPDHLATSPIPVSEFETMFKSQNRRRSLDLGENSDLENQVNDYSKRRYTADNDSNSKSRERDFLKRQITLGNIEVTENSAEDMTLSMQSNKLSSEDLSKSNNDISDTIFKMDSLEVENNSNSTSKATTPVLETQSVSETSKSSKKKRKKVRRKNAPRKSASINQISENFEKTESGTDRSSLGSSSSDPELKDLQKLDKDESPVAPSESGSNIKRIDADFHFFSDTEITTGTTDSRAGSPVHIESVQSDSEFEVKFRKEDVEEGSKSWEWGGFPSISQNPSPTTANPTKEEHRSRLSGMFSFMKQTHSAQNHLQGGMYLSDITTVDPEVAQLYFSNSKKNHDAEMDCESGNGPSLAQSPNSAEGCKSIDSDFEEQTKLLQSYSHDIALSLCGWEPEPNEERFREHMVNFSDLCNNPTLLENADLVVKVHGKYYTWKVASPMIASVLVYGRPLLQSSIDQLCSNYMPSVSKEPETKPETTARSWWRWSRKGTSRETTPAPEMGIEPVGTAATVNVSVSEEPEMLKSVSNNNLQKTPSTPTTPLEDKDNSIKTNTSDKYRKTLRLSSKQIASLNLRDGVNEVEFSVTTAYQGTTRCKCHLYKWKWDDKIVISDIDGTITKSDVLGHLLPIVGKDWAQNGVAQLFNKIKNNGYKLLYLSARAIGQASSTRDYLRSIKQGDLSMPVGPVLLNPTSLITAFHREVIERKPEAFKISCMSDIKALFPPDSNPFYAGYGNKINDVYAYRAVGIPIMRIFTINPRGELKHELTQTFQSSYSNMSYIVDQLFPPLIEAANDYSQFIYWRDPLPAIDDLPEVKQ